MINYQAIECYMLTCSPEPIIEMMEANGITTLEGAKAVMRSCAQANLIGAISHRSPGSMHSTNHTFNKVLTYFENK